MQKITSKLFQPIDGAAIAVFRIGFGLILFLDIIRYGWKFSPVYSYLEPDLLFKYYGFGWVQPWGGDGLIWHHVVLAICAAGICLGLFYRFCIVVFTLGFTYLFLLDQAQYLNHFYMVILFCCLLCVIPAHRTWSLDALRKPKMASSIQPLWCKVLLVGQLEIILLYAGFVKLNADWLNLEPLRMWLASSADLPLLGEYFVQDWSIAVGAYGVIALHLIGAPLLFVKKVRWIVMALYASFHILNHFVFSIGIFPWMTLFASLLFFDADWPRQFYRSCQRLKGKLLSKDIPLYAWEPAGQTENVQPTFSPYRRSIAVFVILWLVLQSVIPLRNFLYPGNVAWNEEGHRFSWRMKLRGKAGKAMFMITDRESKREWFINGSEYLSPRQLRKIPCQPEMILQFAHYLEKVWMEEKGYRDIQIYAAAQCSLNGRRLQPFVNSGVDLTEQTRTLGHRTWVVPLNEPLAQYFLPKEWFWPEH